MRLDRGNVVAIARREYVARGSTRTFKWTTILLVVVGLAIALAPLIFRVLRPGQRPDHDRGRGRRLAPKHGRGRDHRRRAQRPDRGEPRRIGLGRAWGHRGADAHDRPRLDAELPGPHRDRRGWRARTRARGRYGGIADRRALGGRRRPHVRIRHQAGRARPHLAIRLPGRRVDRDPGSARRRRHLADRPGAPVRAARVVDPAGRSQRPRARHRFPGRRLRVWLRARDHPLHGDHPLRPVGRLLRRRGEEQPRHGGHSRRGDAVRAARRQGPRRRRAGDHPVRDRVRTGRGRPAAPGPARGDRARRHRGLDRAAAGAVHRAAARVRAVLRASGSRSTRRCTPARPRS